MMAKKPADRFQTAEEVTELLRRWLVRHADKQWIRKNPAILSGPADAESTTASFPAVSESSTPAPRSLVPADSTADIKFQMFQPDPSSFMDSKIFRPRTAPSWWQFLQRAWSNRRGRDQSDE
jgi:hypothetical protein